MSMSSPPTAYDPTTPRGKVRLLISDTTDDPVFADTEIDTFLALEDDVIKRGAALALETIAGDEVLTSKVIRTQDLSTDGAKVATELRAQAAVWRVQAGEEDGFFDLVDNGSCYSWGAELTERGQRFWL